MKVKEITSVGYYRDGGSIGMGFKAKKGFFSHKIIFYELFLKNRAWEQNPDTDFHSPKIFLESCNSGNLVRELTWEEAKDFVSKLSFSDEKFHEMVKIINNSGKNT